MIDFVDRVRAASAPTRHRTQARPHPGRFVTWLTLLGLAMPGCYLSHQAEGELPLDAGQMADVGADLAFDVGAEDSGVDLGVTADAGTLVGVVVMTQLSPQAPRAAAGAQVVVEDCDTGVRREAATNAQGVARFDADGATCWNVTAVIGDTARSVLRAPVPLPGPLVFPTSAPASPSDTLSPWELEIRDYDGGFMQLSAPGVTRDVVPTRGMVDRALALRDGLAIVLHDETTDARRLRGELVDFAAAAGGALHATARLPLESTRTASTTVSVRPTTRRSVYAAAVRAEEDRGSRYYASMLSPNGGRYEVSFPMRNGFPYGTGRLDLNVQWPVIPGTAGWSAPMAGGTEPVGRDRDACERTATWGDTPLEDGVAHRTFIPPVTLSRYEGDSLDNLVIEVGSSGHRGRMVLRTAGDRPFEWTIESYEVGEARFVGVPPLPSAVHARVGLATRSVYVQFGVGAPSAASYVPADAFPVTVPWWMREGFILGAATDFGPELASCTTIP